MIALAALALQVTLPAPPPQVYPHFPPRAAPPAPPPPPAPRGKARPARLLPLDAPLFTEDNYPLAALRAQATGATTIVMTIDPQGRVSDCGVAVSSGNVALDDATCAPFFARARFSPALDVKGRPTTDFVRQRVRWVLPEDEPDSYRLRLTRDASGQVSACSIVTTGSSKPYDLAECRRLDRLAELPPLTDGVPIDWAAPADWPWPELPR